MKSLTYRLQYALFLLFINLGALISAFGQITPSQDSNTNTAAATTNYGTAATLGVVSSTTSIQTTYIKFDLSSVPTGYTSTNVAKATLKLFVNSVTKAGSLNVDFVNGTWAEKTITADLAPALGGTIASSVPLTTANANDYVLVDVTTAVQDWLNGSEPNDGIALVANSGLSATFDSKENATQSHPAELDVVFTSGGTLSGVTTASGSGLTGGGTSGTLNLSLTKSCSSKQVLQWSGSAWVCAAMSTGGGTGTITGVKAGTDLTGGGTTGTVTLNLDTTKVPQLSTANTFTGNQSITGNLGVTGNVTGSFSGDGTGLAHVNAAQLGGFPATVYPNINLPNTFHATQAFSGNGLVMYAGDPGCGAGFAGIGFGQLSNCNNYAMVGNSTDTFLNRPLNGTLHFRENNTDEMVIYPGGYVGIATPFGAGAQLDVEQQSCCDAAIRADGYFAPGGSGLDGSVGLLVNGGSGDPAGLSSRGSDGIDAFGGTGGSTDGVGGGFVGGFTSSSTTGGDGIDALAGSGYAGNFSGNLNVTGSITAGVKDFKIDHPLDPANKYLVHASVESSEMKNIYDGVVTTDAQGTAMVQLPDWFEALNTDFRYQLTVVGQFAQAIVGHKIENHQFQIKTNAPNIEVSWQVTGVRQDAYAKAHPLAVEEEKDAKLKGFYIHPELYGAPAEKQIEWARHPAMMKRMKERKAKPAPQLKVVATKKP